MRRRGQQGMTGMTLIELLVAMSVGSVVLAGVAAVFVATLRGVTTTNVKASTGADVRVAIEAMTRTIKVAEVPNGEAAAFRSASTNGLAFYALLNRTGTASVAQPVPTLVEYSWSATTKCLSEAQTPGASIVTPNVGGPYYQWLSTATVTRCLLRTTTAPVFTYYPSGDPDSVVALPTGSLSTANLALVRGIGLYITATDPANPGVPGIPAQNRVALENLLAPGGG